jgi:CRISPR-associated protein Cas2
MAQLETMTVVLYDITHDRTRTKVSDKCLDFGLARFQYSAFQGPLTRNRREELALVLERLIEVYGGSIALIPVCSADLAGRIDLFVAPPQMEEIPRLVMYGGDADDDSATDGAD